MERSLPEIQGFFGQFHCEDKKKKKKKGLRQKFRRFFGLIDGEDQQKGLRQEMRIILAVYWCISIIEKEKKVASQVECLGGPNPSRRLPTLGLDSTRITAL